MFGHHPFKKGGYFWLILILGILLPFKEIQAQEKPVRQTNYRLMRGNSSDNQVDQIRIMYSRKTGVSRCGECNALPSEVVTVIVPEDHIGITASSRPTVLWFNKEKITQPVRVTFAAVRGKTLLVKNFEGLPQGFITFTIPEDNPGLEIGKVYKWTVTVVLNEKSPSRNLHAQGFIERTPVFAKSGRSYPNCNVDFARVGIWYDAIACSYSQLNVQKDYPAFYVEDFNHLLEQVNLSELKINH